MAPLAPPLATPLLQSKFKVYYQYHIDELHYLALCGPTLFTSNEELALMALSGITPDSIPRALRQWAETQQTHIVSSRNANTSSIPTFQINQSTNQTIDR